MREISHDLKSNGIGRPFQRVRHPIQLMNRVGICQVGVQPLEEGLNRAEVFFCLRREVGQHLFVQDRNEVLIRRLIGTLHRLCRRVTRNGRHQVGVAPDKSLNHGGIVPSPTPDLLDLPSKGRGNLAHQVHGFGPARRRNLLHSFERIFE